METVFKVGMKVYDQINFPNLEGKVVKIHNDESKYPLGVCFNKEMSIHYYDLKGRFRKDNIPTLSTKPYKIEFQGFEQKAPAPTYEEVIKEARSKGDYYYLPDCLEAPSEELVDATIALLKLLFLRDYYNEGWVYLENSHSAYIIHTSVENELECSYANGINKVMAFKTIEIRNRFFEEQKELLEIAKPLL